MKVPDFITGALRGPEAVGEIAVRSSNVMSGIACMSAGPRCSFTPEECLLTRGLGTARGDGCGRIVEHHRETIPRGGRPIAPREVDERLRPHPAVHGDCVIGLPDNARGELVCAGIVPIDGTVVGSNDLREFARDAVATSLVPTSFVSRIRCRTRGTAR